MSLNCRVPSQLPPWYGAQASTCGRAIQVQLKIARVPPMDVLNAKEGTDYPLTPEELQWCADMFSG